MQSPAPFLPVAAPNGTTPIHISTIAPYNISNYVICALYIILIIWALFNLYTHLSSRLLIDAPKLLFAHVVAWGIVRVTFALLPNTTWTGLQREHSVVQVGLDLLPEYLFLCIFSLLIAMWTNVFARSKYLQLRRPENILWATHGVLCFTMLLGLVTLLGVVAGYLKTHKDPSIPPAKRGITLYQTKFRVWESWWIIASAVVILTGTILFGVGVARSLSKMQLISDFLKRQASKVRLLLIITFTGIVLKVVYNLAIAKAVNQWRRKNPSRTKENSFAAIFFFYLFLTDIVPIIFVLVVFISPRKYKRSGSGREYAQYSEDILDHTNSSDGLLSNDESY